MMPLHAADDTAIEHGRYLVKAGDCAACHTAEGGQAFAGGRAMAIPFGKVYTTNITPDKDTGIGDWTEADLYRAMHTGIGRDGQHLYPAFPYPWFTRVTAADVHDIKAYLDTIEPVHQANKPTELAWPANQRGVIGLWNKLYFHEGEFVDDPKQSAAWNRGAYLVDGLGHCAGCHTDKNFAGAPKKNKNLQGGPAENAFAPSLAGGLRDGLGAWSVAEITEYLKTGSNGKSAAAGPMAEIVTASTQYLSDADLTAIATYLKDLPSTESEMPHGDADNQQMTRGAAIYADNCSGCHMGGGEGLASVFPPLKDSSAVQAKKADTLVGVLLRGAAIPGTQSKPTGLKMPAFDDKLDDAQIADVVSYIRNAWGNRSSTVSASDVARMRKAMKKKKGSE
ncbi:MAG TPA: c-type cytochrome [Xanthomonadaceae bacterium]|nr:c-type cytochrome [Xanthomonadaceae bacterium]